MSESPSVKQTQPTKQSSSDGTSKVKCLIQQCLKSKLQTRLEDKEKSIEAEHVEVCLKKKYIFKYCMNL